MEEVYKVLAYFFICVVILAITIVCVNHYAEKKSKGWKIDCTFIIDFPLFVAVMIIMDAPVKAATGFVLVSLLITIAAVKEARKDDDADT